MKRRKFFKKAGIGVVAAAALPLIPLTFKKKSSEIQLFKSNLNWTEQNLLDYIFKNDKLFKHGDITIALHTSEPTEADMHEMDYKGYARQVVPATRENWKVRKWHVVNRKEIRFPQCKERIEGTLGRAWVRWVTASSGGEIQFSSFIKHPLYVTEFMMPVLNKKQLDFIEIPIG